jgi:hypothetical protein
VGLLWGCFSFLLRFARLNESNFADGALTPQVGRSAGSRSVLFFCLFFYSGRFSDFFSTDHLAAAIHARQKTH